MYYVSRLFLAAALLALFAAAWFSIRLAQADTAFRKRAPESVARAAAILPRNTEYLAFRALQLEYDGQDSTALLERVANLNPLASAPRIHLGLAAEVRGDFGTSEKWLLEAARIDRQFEPCWTLANYYFRRQNAPQFWIWIRQALEVSYGDRRPVFDLCWRMTDDPQKIFTRAIPDRHEVLAAYLLYLREVRHLSSEVAPVAVQLAAARDSKYQRLLRDVCASLLTEHGGDSARRLWIAMGHSAPFGVMNGDFAHAPADFCFDWRLEELPGLNHRILDQPSGIHIALSGQQPEVSRLLDQYVSLAPQKRYKLSWQARTMGLSSPSGIGWWIEDPLIAPIPPGEEWQTGEALFTARSDLFDLSLVYTRPRGQPRAEGYIDLRGVRIVEMQ
jgi:tetratricopeptide (TPR) repeat protein